MKKIYLVLITLFFACSLNVAFAQVSVTATAATLTGSYTTLKGAFDAINSGVHSGSIVINITANTNEGVNSAVLFTGDSDPVSYTSVLIQPSVDGVSISGTPASGRGVIEIKGGDDVTINGDNPNTGGINRNLTINNNAISSVTFGSVVRLANSTPAVSTTDNFTLKNCILNGNVTTGNSSLITATSSSSYASFGIYCGGGGGNNASDAPTAITNISTQNAPAGTSFANLFISNNLINQCGRAIAINGAAFNVCNIATISNNTIGEIGRAHV